MKRVTKAVIPAAGWGTRFLSASKAIPKEMFPIVDKPVIQYIVEEAALAGIQDIYIITGKNKTAINRHFSRNDELEKQLMQDHKSEMLNLLESLDQLANIHFVTQKKALGLGHAVWCAGPYVGDEPFAVLLGDMISEGPESGIKPLLGVYHEKQSTVLAVEQVEWSDAGKYGIVDGFFSGDRLMTVNKLIEKPKEDPPSNYAIMGRYVLDPSIFAILGKMSAGSRGEIQLTDALQHMVKDHPVFAYLAEGKIHDAGDKLGYLQATVLHALRHPVLKDPFRSFLGQIVSGEHVTISIDRRKNR